MSGDYFVVRTDLVGGPLDGETMYFDGVGPAFIEITAGAEHVDGPGHTGLRIEVKTRAIYRRVDNYTFQYEVAK
jgi:hypothetical protein